MPGSFELPLEIERKLYQQIDFALVLTYTRAAQVAQEAVRLSLPKSFTIRNNFVANGIRVEPATKRNPQAAVFGRTDGPFSIDFMVGQETGGIKNPRGKHVAVPTSNVKRSKKDIITRANRPNAKRNNKKVFKIEETTPNRYKHGLEPGIYQRVGRRTKKKGGKLKLLFALEKTVRLEPRFEFVQTATKAIQDAMPKIFEEALAEAVRTAR